jgi:hypothetical protein
MFSQRNLVPKLAFLKAALEAKNLLGAKFSAKKYVFLTQNHNSWQLATPTNLIVKNDEVFLSL